MLDPRICPACGHRSDHPVVHGEGHAAVVCCGACGHRAPLRRLPLFAVTGPSGGGKSTVGPLLARRLGDRVLVLEQDVLWVAGLRESPEPGRPHPFRSTWLRLAAMLHQHGRPVVLCGTVAPPELEPLPERAFFADVHYLGLTAHPDALAARLRARPAWRGWDEPRIAEMLEFAAWLATAEHDPPVPLVDTTDTDPETVADHVAAWIAARL